MAALAQKPLALPLCVQIGIVTHPETLSAGDFHGGMDYLAVFLVLKISLALWGLEIFQGLALLLR